MNTYLVALCSLPSWLELEKKHEAFTIAAFVTPVNASNHKLDRPRASQTADAIKWMFT